MEKSQQATKTYEEKEVDLRYTVKLQDKRVNELEAKLQHNDCELKLKTSRVRMKN